MPCPVHHLTVISIHAPVKGATSHPPATRGRSCDFNPRSRKGSDHGIGRKARGHCHFNPRSRKGSDWQFSSSESH